MTELPEYDRSSSFKTLEKDDYQEFLNRHRGHRLEELTLIEDSIVSESDYGEPVKVSYFKATNGREQFVIKRFRNKIDEPLKYAIVPGDYRLRCVSLSIQAREIEKQLASEFPISPLPRRKILDFIRLYRAITAHLDPGNLAKASEVPNNPLEVYYKMDEVSLVTLLRNCRKLFEGQQYSAIERFIQREKDDGVLLLKATYAIQFKRASKAGKEIASRLLSSEQKRAKSIP